MNATHYVYKVTPAPTGSPLFFVFHGTGGDETQFLRLASELLPGAHVIAPRGDVSEHGALRYFKRKAEGVYDMADLAERTSAMADFVSAHKERTGAARVIGLRAAGGHLESNDRRKAARRVNSWRNFPLSNAIAFESPLR